MWCSGAAGEVLVITAPPDDISSVSLVKAESVISPSWSDCIVHISFMQNVERSGLHIFRLKPKVERVE